MRKMLYTMTLATLLTGCARHDPTENYAPQESQAPVAEVQAPVVDAPAPVAEPPHTVQRLEEINGFYTLTIGGGARTVRISYLDQIVDDNHETSLTAEYLPTGKTEQDVPVGEASACFFDASFYFKSSAGKVTEGEYAIKHNPDDCDIPKRWTSNKSADEYTVVLEGALLQRMQNTYDSLLNQARQASKQKIETDIAPYLVK